MKPTPQKPTKPTPHTPNSVERPTPHYARAVPSVGLTARPVGVSRPVVGVDPGGRTTAVVLVGVEKPRFALVENRGELLLPPVEYVSEVVGTVRDFVPEGGCLVAVEGVNRPSWHVGGRKRGAASNPTGLLGACVVVGGLMIAFPELVIVAPGGNGSRPLGCYPSWLVSERERRREGWELKIGTGRFRHGRSAYDIAVRGAGLSSV